MTAVHQTNEISSDQPFDGSAKPSFFDPALDTRFLEKAIIPTLMMSGRAGDHVRAWAMGCGTGESAYTLAILLCDADVELGTRRHVTVFATDTDRHALGIARIGRYPSSAVAIAAQHRLARWFHVTDSEYLAIPQFRKACSFSVHDLVTDPPFSNLDIVHCGDVLGNLSPQVQDRAMTLLHFVLRPGGCLIPGAGHDMARHHALFAPIEGAEGIYRRVERSAWFIPSLPLTSEGRSGRADVVNESDPLRQVDRLQSELNATKAELRATVAQLQTTNRRLQASNDEYQTLNEELQSANEELSMSKAELHSINNELTAVNSELAHRIDAFKKSSADLRNFLEGTKVSTMFLDKDLRLIRFSSAVARIFRVIPSDVGRPITDLACDLDYPCFRDDADQVLRTLGTVERKVRAVRSDVAYLVRLLPYRDDQDVIAGIVVTFMDVSALALAEDAVRMSDDRFRTMVSSVPAVFFIADATMGWTYVNPQFYALTGLRDGAALGSGWLAAVHPDDRAEVTRLLAEDQPHPQVIEHEIRLHDATRGHRWYLLRAIANTLPGAGTLAGWTGSLLDIHDRRVAESRQRALSGELQRRVKTIIGAVRSVADHAKGSSASVDDFFAHFDGRLNALARVQTAVARQPDLEADLEALISEELLSHVGGCEERVAIDGPAVRVGEQHGQAIALAIHELATNAIKYGALSISAGTVDVSWRISSDDDHRLLHLEWSESTVPLLDTNPQRMGFGRAYLERRLPTEFGARTNLEFRPGGIRCAIDCPLPRHPAEGGAA